MTDRAGPVRHVDNDGINRTRAPYKSAELAKIVRAGAARQRALERLTNRTIRTQHGRCHLCHHPLGDRPHIVPIHPLSQGGPIVATNTVAICDECTRNT